MSTLHSGLPPARVPQSGRVRGLRALILVFLCFLLLWSNVLGGWVATPAQAASHPNPNPNPTLTVPAALQPSAAVKPPDLGQYVHGKQNTTIVPIPRPPTTTAAPLISTITTQALQVFSHDGTFEIDLAANSVSRTQITSAGGTIHLVLTQVDGPSGGDASGRLLLGTYQVSLQDAHGTPLTTLVLAHPFTFRYHAPKAQQSWFWQDQPIQALWQVSPTATTSTSKAATAGAPLPSMQIAQKDAHAPIWSISTDLRAANGTSTKNATASVLTPAAASSTITFSTEAPTASWGKAEGVDVGVSSGSANSAYPLSLPPGPGGLTPPLSLTYSSGSVSETHNVQATAPWIGEGWNLSLGSITWSQENVTPGGTNRIENVWHINDPNGISGQLIPPDLNAATAAPTSPAMNALPAQYIWHTAPESHAKIQEINFNGSPCWHAWLPNGTMEEFGCVDEARQSAKDANGNTNPYRWDLDLIVDRYGNQIRIHYQRNSAANGIRDAEISSIEYDDPNCHTTNFNGATAQCSSWNPKIKVVFDATTKPANLTNATGCQNWTSTSFRCDDPVDLSGSSGLTIANALNTFVLNDLKVLVNGNILREYAFSYDQNGPQTITDPLSGLKESVAGNLNLTKIQQLGTNGTTLNAPVTTMTYTQMTQHYVDLARHPLPATNCGPSWTPRNSSGCFLWQQSYNSYYLNTLDNGMGWHATMTWKEARNNTHGVDSGAANNPFTCTGKESTSNLCGQVDDGSWSRIVLTQRVEQTNGVSSTWGYQYFLNGLTAKPCPNCNWGATWGNQNDNDFADFYNGRFTSFASAQVTNPDNSFQTDFFASTNGWGIAESSITCFLTNGSSCFVAPYWNPDPGMAGHLKTEQDFSATGALMQVTNNTYAMNCPPTGVSHSGNASGPPNNPGNQYLISELDQNNPVVVCDPRITQEDTYQVDGVTDVNGYQSDARVVHKTVSTSYDGDNQGVSAYDYGNVSKVDTTGNDVGGLHFLETTTTFPNDHLGSNVYLTDLPGFVTNLDGSGTFFGCTAYIYGSNNSAPQAPSIPGVTQQLGYLQQHNGCVPPTVGTEHTYDSSGNPITATDPDGHLGCTSGSTQYSACATYDSFNTHLITALNAKNQAITYHYDASSANAGYGQWLLSSTDANGQTTTYGYDVLGRLTSEIKPGDTQSQPTTSYTYTNTCTSGSTTPCLELDTTTRVTSGSNTVTTTRQWYDGMGRLVETQSPGPNLFSKTPAISSLLVTYTMYDNMGRATTQSLPYAIASSATIGYAVPDLNQAHSVTSYDSLDRSLGVVIYGVGSTITSEETTSYTVAQGLPSFNVDTSTAFEQTTILDAYSHQKTTYTDALGQDRYQQVFNGTGTSSNPYSVVRTVQYNRDEVGNVTSTITFDATSTTQATRSSIYDGLQQVTGWNDSDEGSCANTPMPTACSSPSDTAWKVTYDANGNQLNQTDPRNVTTYTSYDALDRPLCNGTTSAQVNPCQSSAYATYFYDSYDNSSNSGVTFPSGCAAPSGASDPIGAKTAETFSSAAGSGWRCSGYDARGQQIATALSVTADNQTTTQTVSSAYNDAGNLTTLTYPDGEIVASNYDNNGYFRGMSNANGAIVSAVQYTNNGEVAGLTLGGTIYQGTATTPVTLALGYDAIQRPASNSVSVRGTTLFSQTQTYDNTGNVLQLSTTLPTSSGGSKTDNQSFCYDALNRLVWAGNAGTPTGGDHCGSTPGTSTTTPYSQSFAYDALDRITQGPAGTNTYGDASHVHAVTGLSTVPNQYASYDAMGNMTCRNTDTTGAQSCAAGTQTGATMSYDNEGRLANWKASGSTASSDQFLYDNEGNRVLQRSNSTTGSTTTVADNITFDKYTDTVITNGTASTTKYYSAGGQLVAEATGTAWYYLISDLLGSTTLALKSDGTLQAAQLFAPYGLIRYSDGTIPTPHNFTGQRLDAPTGLLYYNARYYDPLAGVFTSTDSVQGNDQGINPYGYTYENPETYSDPTGHIPFPEVDPEGVQLLWKILIMVNFPGLALSVMLGFPQPSETFPTPGHTIIQGQSGPSNSLDTDPTDSPTTDPMNQKKPVPDPKGKGDKGKGDKGGGKGDPNKKIQKSRPTNQKTNQKSSGNRIIRHSNGGYNKYQSTNLRNTPSSYTRRPVTIDISPAPIYIPPSISQPYTAPSFVPAPDPSWWVQAISWTSDVWDQATTWVSNTWEEDAPEVESGIDWLWNVAGEFL